MGEFKNTPHFTADDDFNLNDLTGIDGKTSTVVLYYLFTYLKIASLF